MKKVVLVILLTSLFGIVIARSPAERMIFSQAVARMFAEDFKYDKCLFSPIYVGLKSLFNELKEMTKDKPVVKAVCLKAKVKKREVIVCRDVK